MSISPITAKAAKLWVVEEQWSPKDPWLPIVAAAEETRELALADCRGYKVHYGNGGAQYRVRKYVREEPK